MVSLMNLTEKAAYEAREIDRHLAEMHNLEKCSLAHKRDAKAKFLDAIVSDPELIAERVDWLLAGHYGHGAYLLAHKQVSTEAAVEGLLMMIAQCEWMCTKKWASLAFTEAGPDRIALLIATLGPVLKRHREES